MPNNGLHCTCDKGQPNKPCRIFDGNDELYHNSLLARQIAETLTNGGFTGASLLSMHHNIMEHVKLVNEAQGVIDLMLNRLDILSGQGDIDDNKDVSSEYTKMCIQITGEVKTKKKLEKRLAALYHDMEKVLGIRKGPVLEGEYERACCY